MEAIFKKKYTVQVSEIDFKQELKLSSLFVYLQDMGTEHANNLGVGRNVIQPKYGVIWVLTRIRVDVMRYPKFKEEITIETWPEQPEKIEFNRNFLVYGEDGNIIAKAFTQWVVIDSNSRRLRRSRIIEEKFPEVERERAIDCTLGQIKPQGDLELSCKKTVGYSDIDINEHLNNARYIDYIMDCFSVDIHKKHSVKSIEVNYMHEVLPGETIDLYTAKGIEENPVYIEGKKEDKTSFKAQITIE
ncbi:MAG: acyl-ACP thioesterase [Tissierellia bacterium]|nr:acyl-ACP thioesterase [Tissierellia bacterium]